MGKRRAYSSGAHAGPIIVPGNGNRFWFLLRSLSCCCANSSSHVNTVAVFSFHLLLLWSFCPLFKAHHYHNQRRFSFVFTLCKKKVQCFITHTLHNKLQLSFARSFLSDFIVIHFLDFFLYNKKFYSWKENNSFRMLRCLPHPLIHFCQFIESYYSLTVHPRNSHRTHKLL